MNLELNTNDNYKIETLNAKISSVSLYSNPVLSCELGLNLPDGMGVRFGNCRLDRFDKERNKCVGTAIGLSFIMEIMNVVGVNKWEDLINQYVRVKVDNSGKIIGIGNIMKDEWLYPNTFFDENKALDKF